MEEGSTTIMQNQVIRSTEILNNLIKNNLYSPKNWLAEGSNESFTNELLPLIKEHLIYDIVSTSNESQSSVLNTGAEITNCVEDNTL